MYIAYFLSMPNIGSWNRVWTGKGKRYVVVRRYDNKKSSEIMEGKSEIIEYNRIGSIFCDKTEKIHTGRFSKSWYYNFGDGWGASIRAEVVDSQTANKLRKQSDGFCGYEWMVSSIEKYDEIKITKKVV